VNDWDCPESAAKKRRTVGSGEGEEDAGDKGEQVDTGVSQLTKALGTVVEMTTKAMAGISKQLERLAKKQAQERGDDSSEDDDDGEDKATLGLRRDRALLKGDVRLKEVGYERFKRERELHRKYEGYKMPLHEPMAKQYNEALLEQRRAEEDSMEQEEIVLKLSKMPEVDATKLRMAKAKEVLLHQEWMRCDDRLALVGGMVEIAQEGKLPVALKMYENMKATRRQAQYQTEMRKHEKQAERDVRREMEIDRAALLARQLGEDSALMATQEGKRMLHGSYYA